MTFIFDALRWIGILFLVLLLFNLVIVVHEWGHFLAARWRGLKILKFQIWFGKCIWKKTINGVQYGLGTIPFGGFVSLPQMAPMETIEGKAEVELDENGVPQAPLKAISPMDKIIVAFAGPLFSFLLAVFFAFIVWGVGKPFTQSETEAIIGYVDSNRPAGQPGGLQVGDQVTAINGKPVTRFAGPINSVMWGIVSSEEDDIVFDVIRGGKPEKVIVNAPTSKDPDFIKWAEASWWTKVFSRPPMRRVGISHATKNIAVKDTEPNSPAALAGLKEGDLLRKINGKPLYSMIAVYDAIKTSPKAPISFEIERAGAPMTISVTPRIPDEPKNYSSLPDSYGEIGLIAMDNDAQKRKDMQTDIEHPTPYHQVSESLTTTFSTLGALLSPKSSVQPGHMSSAIGIISIYHQLFSIENGWRLILWFTVVLNINLAILNMLPLPVLDGGHITMAVIEGVRGRALRGRVLEYVQSAFAVMLLSFMVWVMLKDVGGFFGPKDEPIKFYPPTQTTPAGTP